MVYIKVTMILIGLKRSNVKRMVMVMTNLTCSKETQILNPTSKNQNNFIYKTTIVLKLWVNHYKLSLIITI